MRDDDSLGGATALWVVYRVITTGDGGSVRWLVAVVMAIPIAVGNCRWARPGDECRASSLTTGDSVYSLQCGTGAGCDSVTGFTFRQAPLPPAP